MVNKCTFFFLLLTASMALAEDSNFKVVCKPTNSNPNGLGIKSIVLDISTEDPDCVMYLTYNKRLKASVRNMAYEGTDTEYKFTPYGSNDGNVRVYLKKQGSGWIANVFDANIDTYSVLACK